MKKLSKLMRLELGIDSKLASKQWAYTTIVAKHGIGLGIAVANERGYCPVPFAFCNAKTWNEMENHADELNLERGVNADEAMRTVASSMAAQNRGGE